MLFQRLDGPPIEGPPQGVEIEFRVSVYALVRRPDGSILLVLPDYGNQWSFPGGKMEPNETFPVVIRREGLEETGYELRLLREDPVYSGEGFFVTRSGKWCHSIHLIFSAELTRNVQNLQSINPSETRERIKKVAWMELKDLREANVLPMFQDFLKRLKREAKIPELSEDQTLTPGS